MGNGASVFGLCERNLQDLVKFQLKTFSLFFSLSLSLFFKLFLILGQSEFLQNMF